MFIACPPKMLGKTGKGALDFGQANTYIHRSVTRAVVLARREWKCGRSSVG